MILAQDNQEPVRRAIAAVEKECEQLSDEIKKLRNELEEKEQRFNKLKEFIVKGKTLLGIEEPEKIRNIRIGYTTPQEDRASQMIRKIEELGLIEKPVLQGAIEILTEFGRPMKLAEIADEFHMRKWKLSDKNGREVLRFTLKKKIPDIIVKNDDGSYPLAEFKQIR